MDTTCKICGKHLDWRKDEGDAGICGLCRDDLATKERNEFLESLTNESLEYRLQRLEALLYDHDERHPGKVLWQ